jgi:hypothetical protein
LLKLWLRLPKRLLLRGVERCDDASVGLPTRVRVSDLRVQVSVRPHEDCRLRCACSRDQLCFVSAVISRGLRMLRLMM